MMATQRLSTKQHLRSQVLKSKSRAELAQFTYKQYSNAEHWPYLMLFVREGGGAARICNCRFTRQDPTAYPSSEVRCLRDKCIKLASRSCLGKRTVSRNHAILARDFKGNKQFAKNGNVPLKKHKRPCANIGGSAPPLQIIWHGASVWQKAAFHSKHLA